MSLNQKNNQSTEKEAPAATEAEKKLAQELLEKIKSGQISLNEARKVSGLKTIDKPEFDKKYITIK